jgi:hypothetical protein
VSDLHSDEIEIREDGIPQKIATFEGGRFYPRVSSIEVHLLFDCSGSVRNARALDPRVFSANLLNEFPNVSIGVWGFSERTLVNFTTPTRDASRLKGVMDALPLMPAGATPLYRALTEVAGRLARAGGETVRLVVIVSDGLPEQDSAERDDAVRAAQSGGIELFPVLIDSVRSTYNPWNPGLADLQSKFLKIAEMTGGRAFEFEGKGPRDLLDRIFKGMAAEIRYNYVVGYYPVSTGNPGMHKAQVVLQVPTRGRVAQGVKYVQH